MALKGAKNQATGPSQDGETTTIHALRELIGRPFAFMLTGGNAADSPGAAVSAGRLLKGARYLLADKGYYANSLRRLQRQRAIVQAIPGHCRNRNTRRILAMIES